MRPDERKKYFVVQPADLNGKLKEISSRAVSSYPARTQTMDNSLAILKNLALAYGASITNLYDTALPYYEKIKDQPNFDQLPVYIKVDYYYEMADAYSKLGKYDQAIDNANKAIALDTNFDQPSGDWPGYDVTANKPDIKGQISGPYRILGDVYFAQGNFKSAGENYGKALDIAPGNQLAIFGLKLTKLELAKSK